MDGKYFAGALVAIMLVALLFILGQIVPLLAEAIRQAIVPF